MVVIQLERLLQTSTDVDVTVSLDMSVIIVRLRYHVFLVSKSV